MRHFEHLSASETNNIFFKKPAEFDGETEKGQLAVALGASMYSPGTDKKIAERIIGRKYRELTTNVWCFEDAIHENDLPEAIKNIQHQIGLIEEALIDNRLDKKDIPLIFIRVRSVEQLDEFLKNSSRFSLQLITGFNLPKFDSGNGEAYLSLITNANIKHKVKLYAMPILEGEEVMYLETRREELIKVKEIINKYEDIVLNIRLGGTDFSSLYGLRRGIDSTIYDVAVVSSCISDIINTFGRATDNYTLSGMVWEYFPDTNRMLKPQLRVTPFKDDKEEIREEIICKEIDGLIKEIILDKANGLTGKTIIHPTHIKYVNAMQVVSYEEYTDAMSILGTDDKGVRKSDTGNKMNEIKPHTNWATKVIRKAEIYGVLSKDKSYIDLF